MSDIIQIVEPPVVELIVNDVADGVTINVQESNETVELIVNDVSSMANYISKNIITAKGDLIVGDPNGSPVRFPAGNDGFFLQSDSNETNGLKFNNNLDGGNF